MIKQELKQYLEEQFLFNFDENITEDSDLFKAGILDSFGYIQLIQHIEQHYDIKFDESELLGNVMVSLSNMVASIEKKRIQFGLVG
ncbi:acyl carrier protein [Xenorhabdus sp. PB62.4]|uniref:acyl carrier protein n=1 Tax=Xenorhabdus sp. PB62.4 TaxID=1851573 RepID=UPI001CA40C6F|nr:acyl carrier protein [Xenorhabdus sp. PB62.4]MBC8951932.1 D-alanine--poly ligase subunit 2 [Xenorhabdus sp. PB62.4]